MKKLSLSIVCSLVLISIYAYKSSAKEVRKEKCKIAILAEIKRDYPEAWKHRENWNVSDVDEVCSYDHVNEQF